MKITVFWDVAMCNVVDIYQHFRGTCCIHLQVTLKVEARQGVIFRGFIFFLYVFQCGQCVHIETFKKARETHMKT
jgi:hypothetical protein